MTGSHKIILLAIILSLICPGAANAGIGMFLRLSASETDMDVWTSDPFVGERTLYLWGELWGGTCMMDFSFVTSFEIEWLSMQPGFTNFGTVESPFIVPAATLPYDSYLIAALRVRDVTGDGGRVCFGPSPETGRACVGICPDGEWYQPEFVGFRTSGLN